MTDTSVDSPFGLDLTANDRGSWGASLLYNAELVIGVLDAAGGRSVTEVGALDGDLTRLLLVWANRSGASVQAVDPSPRPSLESLAEENARLSLVRESSHVALTTAPLSDTIILDGDHNYYTVSEELRIITERAAEGSRALPLVLLHDVGWPHGRRDDYYDPELIPVEHRQPIAPEAGLYPGDPGTRPGALPYHHPAAREGGPHNGVLTAVQDFVAGREHLRLAIVPSFFGMAILWERSMPEAAALAELLDRWDRNAQVQRLEDNRVLHLVGTQLQLAAVHDAERRLAEQGQRITRQRDLLERILRSRLLWAIERAMRVRRRESVFARAAIRRVLDDAD